MYVCMYVCTHVCSRICSFVYSYVGPTFARRPICTCVGCGCNMCIHLLRWEEALSLNPGRKLFIVMTPPAAYTWLQVKGQILGS